MSDYPGYGIATEPDDTCTCARCNQDSSLSTLDEDYHCPECREVMEQVAIEAANEAEVPLTQAIISLEIAAVNFGMDMGQESLMALLRAHHSLARAQGYVLVTL